MASYKNIQDEIHHLTSALIASGICSDQNYPSLTSANHEDGQLHIISIDGVEDLSFALRNVAYEETYQVLKSKRCFNLNLVDGGLIQMLYTFQRGVLVKHALGFFPSSNLIKLQNDPEIYVLDHLYAEVIHKNVVISPVRFDYDPESYVDYHHPRSHLTIGQYKNCRIPVSAPLTPYQFLSFILRSFYNTAFNSYCSDIRPRADFFEACISEREQSSPHFRSII